MTPDTGHGAAWAQQDIHDEIRRASAMTDKPRFADLRSGKMAAPPPPISGPALVVIIGAIIAGLVFGAFASVWIATAAEAAVWGQADA